jgi:hypothetical protein
MNSSTGIFYRASTIVDRLEAQVRRQLKGRVYGFHLVRRNGGLVVQGRANSYHAKQLATEAVKAATALPILANEIAVRKFAPVLDRANGEGDWRDIGGEG